MIQSMHGTKNIYILVRKPCWLDMLKNLGRNGKWLKYTSYKWMNGFRWSELISMQQCMEWIHTFHWSAPCKSIQQNNEVIMQVHIIHPFCILAHLGKGHYTWCQRKTQLWFQSNISPLGIRFSTNFLVCMINCENATVTPNTATGLWKDNSHNNTTNALMLKVYFYA